jgi:hypothetical protein
MSHAHLLPSLLRAVQALWRDISHLRAFYALQNINGLNALYERAYPSLSREEKRRIENLWIP